MPRTRFQGSKRKLAGWIVSQTAELEFDSVLDAFGGTGSVAYEFKRTGKTVTYNDLLRFNYWIGMALIENDHTHLSEQCIDPLLQPEPGHTYDDVIERCFGGIYFTDSENRWLDVVTQNVRRMRNRHARAMAYYALFQSALAKRPYNLFHRRNLYMRHAEVPRSFGNKTTWERPFEDHFRRFAEEANRAVFATGRPCRAINRDALAVEGNYDLVYIDTPYLNRRGVAVPYRNFYHFLEGLVRYRRWASMIDTESKHRRLRPINDPWTSPSQLADLYDRLFARFADSILVVSYRSDGTPSIDQLAAWLQRYKGKVRVIQYRRYQYALSTNRESREMLLIAG